MPLDIIDHRGDPDAWARQLGVSREAVELVLDSDFIDLHLDLEVPVRVIGYNPTRRHRSPNRPPPLWGHTDLPRLIEAGFTGLVYDIATNPARPPANRQATTLSNIARIQRRCEAHPEALALVTSASEYDQAHASGRLALWLSLQGGNALIHDQSVLDGEIGRLLHRITLVHLTSSRLGGTSSPAGFDRGVGPLGIEMIERCNTNRIFIDLAHAGKKTFWSALEAHSADVPPIVSHTGVDGVRRHWRNLDDDQIRAIVDRGGVVGIMYQSNFLDRTLLYAKRGRIVDHLEHVIRVAGEDAAAIGTDYDGAIVPPGDLPCVTHHPKLVQDMLDRGWSAGRIRKILGQNYLRVVQEMRP